MTYLVDSTRIQSSIFIRGRRNEGEPKRGRRRAALCVLCFSCSRMGFDFLNTGRMFHIDLCENSTNKSINQYICGPPKISNSYRPSRVLKRLHYSVAVKLGVNTGGKTPLSYRLLLKLRGYPTSTVRMPSPQPKTTLTVDFTSPSKASTAPRPSRTNEE